MAYGYPEYQSVAQKKAKAQKAIEKLRKKDSGIEPVIIEGKTLVHEWWGKAWNHNLESYADYQNRISRGRSYVRNGAVLDLRIKEGQVTALVQGSRVKPYTVKIVFDVLSSEKWQQVTNLCNQRIASMEALIEGKFPKELESLFEDKKYGLFPSPKEIHFDCNCPDWAYMCKHVASVLYGIGSRLDQQPLLLFELRGVDSTALIKKSMEAKLESMLKNVTHKSQRSIEEEEALDLFGL